MPVLNKTFLSILCDKTEAKSSAGATGDGLTWTDAEGLEKGSSPSIYTSVTVDAGLAPGNDPQETSGPGALPEFSFAADRDATVRLIRLYNVFLQF